MEQTAFLNKLRGIKIKNSICWFSYNIVLAMRHNLASWNAKIIKQIIVLVEMEVKNCTRNCTCTYIVVEIKITFCIYRKLFQIIIPFLSKYTYMR